MQGAWPRSIKNAALSGGAGTIGISPRDVNKSPLSCNLRGCDKNDSLEKQVGENPEIDSCRFR
jgi:hypothetical protein